jgi:hypothetical protein
MNIFENLGQSLLQQEEGNRLLASALADGARRLGRSVTGIWRYVVYMVTRETSSHRR